MNRWLRTLMLLSFVLTCSTLARGADEKKLTTTYYPLVVGNTWTYKVGENRFSLKVTKMEKVGGKGKDEGTNCARLELIVNGKTVSFEHLAVSGDALARYTYEGKLVTPPIPFLKLPPKKGASWDFESKVDGQLIKGKFVAGEEVVKVPASPVPLKTVTVSSKDLEANGVKMSLTYYFAEKIGMVKQVIEIAGEKAIIELEKFEPAKN